MTVEAKHPVYDEFINIWKMMRDCEAGEEAVKDRGETYLAMPSGFKGQSDGGLAMYQAYSLRAEFPDILQPTLAGMVGLIHRIDANVTGLEDNKPLSYMWEKCTRDDRLPLEIFHRRITQEILLMARYSVLTDVPSGEGPSNWEAGNPYFVGYRTEQLINWSEFENDMFVLDESRKVRGAGDEFSWIDEKRYRVLRLVDGKYQMQLYTGAEMNANKLVDPITRGSGISSDRSLKEIPLVVAGPREIGTRDVDQPPLKGVARASLSIFQLNADYRHQLFMTGQETLFVSGVEDPPRTVGSGVVIGLPENGKAEYVAPKGTGIEAHRTAMTDARQNAVAAGVRLFDTQAKAESGEALRIRSAAQTATLITIAQASAATLEKALRYAAIFVGQDPNEIVVKPNLDFVEQKMNPTDAKALTEVWQSGAISKQTLYENLQRGDIASTERTFEEEQDLISQEAIDDPMSPQAQLQQQDPNLGGTPGGGDLNRFIEDGTGLQIG